MALLKTVITTQEKFDLKESAGTLQADTQYIIVNSGMTVDDRFKGTYYGLTYAEALTSLETAYPETEAGSYAILNPEGLPPKYAIWDDNESTPHWAISSDVIPIEVNNSGHNVTLTLAGNVLSADFDDSYILNEIAEVSTTVDNYIEKNVRVWYGKLVDYSAIPVKNPNTLYFIIDQVGTAFLGTVALWDAGVSAESYVYVVGDVRRQIFKFNKNNLDTMAASSTLSADMDAMCLDETYIYVGLNNNTKINKFLKSTLALQTTVAGSAFGTIDMKCDSDYIYSISSDNKLRKFAKTDGTQLLISVGSLGGGNKIGIDDTYVYHITANGILEKYLKSDLSFVGSVNIGTFLKAMLVDGDYIYIGTNTTDNGKILKYDKTTLGLIGETAVLGHSVDGIDKDQAYLYAVGSGNIYGIMKVTKNDLTLVANSTEVFGTGVIKVSGGLVFVAPLLWAPNYTVRAFRTEDLGYHTISVSYGSVINKIDCL